MKRNKRSNELPVELGYLTSAVDGIRIIAEVGEGDADMSPAVCTAMSALLRLVGGRLDELTRSLEEDRP